LFLYRILSDDGISGTTFDRPDFKAAINLVEAGRVKNFIVKDMSRFGRDYIQVGLYTEVMFPEADVRFVALHDNVDSNLGDNEFTPFRNIINEWYARDVSKKVRAVLHAKGMAGEPMARHVPYGYLRGPGEKKHWVVDEEAAEVVRQIFRWCMAGLGTSHIAHRLREAKILCPSYHVVKRGRLASCPLPESPYGWNPSNITAILSRTEYLGHTVNFKTRTKSYKSKKTVFNDPSQYVIFESTHEAIIDQDTFDRVQQIRAAGKRRRNSSGRVGLFSGITYCADCGSKMNMSSASNFKPEQDYYTCSGFRSKKRPCNSSHYIRRAVLEQLALEQIQHVTSFAAEYEREFVKLLEQDGADKSRKEQLANKRKLTQATSRIAELDTIIQGLYEDKVAGVLTNERFIKLSRGYEAEQQKLQAQVAELAELIVAQEQKKLDLSRFLKQVRKYTHVEELTPTMLNELVERIEIHAPDKSSGRRTQEIDVYFNFVGLIGKLNFSEPKASKPGSRANAGIGQSESAKPNKASAFQG